MHNSCLTLKKPHDRIDDVMRGKSTIQTWTKQEASSFSSSEPPRSPTWTPETRRHGVPALPRPPRQPGPVPASPCSATPPRGCASRPRLFSSRRGTQHARPRRGVGLAVTTATRGLVFRPLLRSAVVNLHCVFPSSQDMIEGEESGSEGD